MLTMLESPHNGFMCLVKYFGNNKRSEWKNEMDVMTLLHKDGGHPNVIKNCWSTTGKVRSLIALIIGIFCAR